MDILHEPPPKRENVIKALKRDNASASASTLENEDGYLSQDLAKNKKITSHKKLARTGSSTIHRGEENGHPEGSETAKRSELEIRRLAEDIFSRRFENDCWTKRFVLIALQNLSLDGTIYP